MPAPISRPHLPSPVPNHTPLFTASPGPIKRPNNPPDDNQDRVALTHAQKGKRKRTHYCLICNVEEDHTDHKCKDHCSWCSNKEHTSNLCKDPHTQCSSDDCIVPLTHEFYRLICPELVAQMAVNHLCKFCDQVSNVCMEAKS
jgi:hypothetical protein